MSRVRTTLTALSAAMISLSGPAFAESIERTFKPAPSRNVMSILNGAESNGPAANQIPAQQTPSVVDGRTINITQPTVPDAVPQANAPQQPVQAAPAPQQPVQQQPVKQAEPAPRKSRSNRGVGSGLVEGHRQPEGIRLS
jgi:FtsZ-interacting cell division protein ZipA